MLHSPFFGCASERRAMMPMMPNLILFLWRKETWQLNSLFARRGEVEDVPTLAYRLVSNRFIARREDSWMGWIVSTYRDTEAKTRLSAPSLTF